MNLVSKHRLVSCSTQTQSEKKIKVKEKDRIPSLKNIKLRLDQLPYYNNQNNKRIPSLLKGKKVLKKKKILDLYNNLYNSKEIFTPDKKINLSNNSNNNKHNKGEIALSFGVKESPNQIIINGLNFNKKNNFRIIKKRLNYNDEKCPLLNNQVYELPLYNVSKVLKNKRMIIYRNNNKEQNNIYQEIKINHHYNTKCKEEFPIITQNSNNFDSTEIKRDNDKILKDLFRKNCIINKKLNKKKVRQNFFKKSILDNKKLDNCFTQEKSKIYNDNNLIKSKINKKTTPKINCIKNKAKKLYNFKHNRTTDNII